MFEMGAQFHKTPEVYTDYGNLGQLLDETDNEFTDIINNIKVYPVIKFRLSGRIF
jgi:Cdc6-like AAA superfamily ATPase